MVATSTISGEVLSTDGATTAMAQLRGEFGVRRALGGLSQVVAQKPYSWFASRQGDSAVLGGFVPDLDTAAANRTAMEAALPGMRIADRQTVAFGAPEGFVAMTAAMITELPKLSSGRATLDDGRFCIEGKAASPDAFLGLQAALAQPAQPGFRAVTCDLEPPAVSPYRWSAERQAGGDLILRGFYPGAEPHGRILAAIQRAFGSAVNLKDELKPALGAPATFLDKVARAVTDLARLSEGRAEITDNVYSLSGKGPGRLRRLPGAAPADCADGRARLRRAGRDRVPAAAASAGPGRRAVAGDAGPDPARRAAGRAACARRCSACAGARFACTAPAPAVPPPAPAAPADTAKPAAVSPAPVPLDWSARRADGRVDLNGPVFGAAARAVLADLLRLDLGTASVEDDRVRLRGLTCRELMRSEIQTSATSGLPQGFKADVSIGLRETGCVADPPASCQNQLDGLTRGNTVLFGQGTTVVELDEPTERVIGEAAAILGKCAGSVVTIEGHANRDGEWRGYDNMDLSLRRALRVRDELERRGIDPAQLAVKAYGSTPSAGALWGAGSAGDEPPRAVHGGEVGGGHALSRQPVRLVPARRLRLGLAMGWIGRDGGEPACGARAGVLSRCSGSSARPRAG
ncbi:OmpA family protein, partial [Bosea thiooxidans]